jgi:pseudomonalisin
MKSKVARAVAVFALAAGALLIPGAAGASSNWAPTHSKALHLRGRLIGKAPGSMRIKVSTTLPLRDRSAINRLIEERTILSRREVVRRFSPTTAEVHSVTAYLASEGFKGLRVSSDRLLVTGSATVAETERAFRTTISLYRLAGHTVYANTSPAMVPSALKSDVSAVIGLSDVPMHLDSVKASAAPDLSGFSPRALQHAYDASKMAPSSSTSIAVIANGDMAPIIANLRYAEMKWHFGRVPVTVAYDGPKQGIVENNPMTGNAEWDLDTQISTMMAGAVKRLYIYDVATFTDPEVARGINMFVSQDRARGLSASLGECDYIAFLDGAMLTSDEALAEGALQGQSMFASTGDNGYACPEVASSGVPEGPPGDSWPADGEYTTGVGGTSLWANSAGKVTAETAWVGGGGGVSPWETAAPWTLQANTAGQTWEYTNQGGRSVPDVSAVADPFTPVLIYTGHKKGTTPSGVGGTSVASPLTLGLWARVEQARHNRLGLAQYDFYALYNKVNPATVENGPLGPTFVAKANPSPVTGFRDITLGTNGGCVAKSGYDYCTGIGSLQAEALAKALGRRR